MRENNLILLQDTSEVGLLCSLWLATLQALGADLLLRVSTRVWVQSQENLLVVKWVLLLDASTLGLGEATSSTDDTLDFRGVDEPANIGLGDDWRWEEEVLLEG